MEGLTTDSLDFICPKPDRWHAIYKDLIRAYERKYNKKLPKTAPEIYASGGPPTPLILGGWWGSTVEAKRPAGSKRYSGPSCMTWKVILMLKKRTNIMKISKYLMGNKQRRYA